MRYVRRFPKTQIPALAISGSYSLDARMAFVAQARDWATDQFGPGTPLDPAQPVERWCMQYNGIVTFRDPVDAAAFLIRWG